MTKANLKVVDDKKMDSSEKTKALDVAMGQIEQTYGKGSIMKLGQRSVTVSYTHLTLPTILLV